jgi:hypothetical protein
LKKNTGYRPTIPDTTFILDSGTQGLFEVLASLRQQYPTTPPGEVVVMRRLTRRLT